MGLISQETRNKGEYALYGFALKPDYFIFYARDNNLLPKDIDIAKESLNIPAMIRSVSFSGETNEGARAPLLFVAGVRHIFEEAGFAENEYKIGLLDPHGRLRGHFLLAIASNKPEDNLPAPSKKKVKVLRSILNIEDDPNPVWYHAKDF